MEKKLFSFTLYLKSGRKITIIVTREKRNK